MTQSHDIRAIDRYTAVRRKLQVQLFISVPNGNSKEARGTKRPLVIAGKLNAYSLSADELDGCQMDGVQCANWSRKRC